jgi:hypothetical protein
LAGCLPRIALAAKQSGFRGRSYSSLWRWIGVNTTIFSIVNSELLKPLAFKNPSRLAIIWESSLKSRGTISPVSAADFIDWHDQT